MKRIIALFIVTTLLLCGCVTAPLDGKNDESLPDFYESSIESTDESKNDSDEGSVIGDESEETVLNGVGEGNKAFDLASLPAYTGSPYCVINDNIPTFSASELTTESYEYYTELDDLGRCGMAIASVGIDIMPTEDRGSIGSVKPSGWQTVKYDFVDGKYLYNRCHLLGFQLTGENANVKNLITGTRYMNVQGMLPFENMVADYVKETENHVAFRVTPIFTGNELLARGVLMEAYSIEDEGEGICFSVFCYNVQPNVRINYANGESWEESEELPDEVSYVLNTSSKKFHRHTCASVNSIKAENYAESDKTRDELIALGYSPCGSCNP